MNYKLYTLDNEFIEEVYRLPNNFTGIIKYSNGTKEWYFEGKIHRIDGPAVEYSVGTKQWFVEGKRHRIGGPAIEWFDGTKHWYINGKEAIEEEHDLLYSIMKLKGL